MFEEVKQILSHYTEAEITPNCALAADLGLSSFDVVAIVSEFEDRFDIEVEDRDIASFVTLGDIMAYLEART